MSRDEMLGSNAVFVVRTDENGRPTIMVGLDDVSTAEDFKAQLAAPESLSIRTEMDAASDPELAAAISRWREAGSFVLPAEVVRRASPRASGELTSREREVLELRRQDLSTKKIAKRLLITERAAQVHLEVALEKLGVRSVAEALRVLSSKPPPGASTVRREQSTADRPRTRRPA